jgi:hypothetical protein
VFRGMVGEISELYTDKKRDLTKLKSKSITFFPSRKMQDSIII